jgi:prephenate dehydrogenase
MSKKLNLPQINKQLDMERIKKENPSLYASIQEKNKSFNKTVKK